MLKKIIKGDNEGTLNEQFIKALRVANIREIKRCFFNGVNPNCSLQDKQTALHIAAERGDFSLMTLLAQSPKLNPNLSNVFGESPLHLACQFGKIRCIKFLLSIGANVNMKDHTGQTPICKLILKNDLLNTLLLLKNGADANSVDAFERTVLGISAHQKRPNMYMIRMLVRYGANVNHVFDTGPSILLKCTLCCRRGSHIRVIKYLIEQGADLNAVDPISGKGVLHMVALTGCHQLAEALLSYREADLFTKDNSGNMPIEVALIHGHRQVAQHFEDHMNRVDSTFSIGSLNKTYWN